MEWECVDNEIPRDPDAGARGGGDSRGTARLSRLWHRRTARRDDKTWRTAAKNC